MFKKSSLALAVAGFAFASSAVAAPSVDLYGRIDLGVEYYSDEDGVGADIAPGQNSKVKNTDERDFTMSNGNHSRLGVKGSQELDNGLTFAYQYELKAQVLGGGMAPETRHGWLSISKGAHTLKVGTQDNYFLLYGGLNGQIGEVHGFGAYYYTTCDMPGSMSCTFRTDSTLAYTFGGGAFSGDTFTATIAAHVAGDDRGFSIGEGDDKESFDANSSGITGLTAGAEVNLGALALTGAYQTSVVSESEAFEDNFEDAELPAPSIVGLGARYAVMDGMNVGLNYQILDRDIDEDSNKTSFVVGGDYQATEDFHIHAGFGMGEDDNDNARQLDSNLFAQFTYATSDSSHVRLELEQVSYSSDDPSKEGDAMIALVSLRQNF
jgi:predicted porin